MNLVVYGKYETLTGNIHSKIMTGSYLQSHRNAGHKSIAKPSEIPSENQSRHKRNFAKGPLIKVTQLAKNIMVYRLSSNQNACVVYLKIPPTSTLFQFCNARTHFGFKSDYWPVSIISLEVSSPMGSGGPLDSIR
jgi:hypothetical protein